MAKAHLIALRIAVLLIAIIGSIAPASAGTVTAATGGNAISADTAATGGTGAWTALTGPTYAETVNGDVNNGTVVLTIPAGFEFNTASVVVVRLVASTGGTNQNINNTPLNGTIATTVTATTITFTVTDKSSGGTRNTIRWEGIQVRPINGSPLSTGNITPGGTSGIAAVASSTNFGTLTMVAGAMTRLHTVLPGQAFTAGTGVTGSPTNRTAGTAFNITSLVAADQFNNVVNNYGGPKTISYTGPATTCAAAPTYTTSVTFANGTSTTALATTLIKAETTTITASDGTITGPASSSFTVDPGAVSRLVVTLPGETFTPCIGNSGTPSDQIVSVTFTIPSVTATDTNYNVVTTYTGAKTLSYSGPAGANSYTTAVNFAAGQSTTSLSTTINTAQTTTITVGDGTTSGPASSSFNVLPPVSSFNAFESTTGAGATTGILKTKIAGTAFGFHIVAITAGPAVSTGFTGQVKVELVDGSAGTCATFALIQSLPDQTFVAGDNGRHAVTGVTEANAWKNARVRISYPVASPTIVSCSSDNFAIRPDTLAIAVTDADWLTAGTARTLNNTALPPGGVTHKAGRPFTITLTGKNSANVTTANYAHTAVATPITHTLSQCSSGTAVCPAVGSLGTLSLGTWSSLAGVATTTTASYSEVGAFGVLLEDRLFADVDAADSSTAERYVSAALTEVGRFVPDYFSVTAVSLTPRTDIAACSTSTFTYMNEPFQVSFQLTARDMAGGVTLNYAGAVLATLSTANASHLNFGGVNATGPVRLTAAISAITAANPGQVTTVQPHGLATGGTVYISGVAGMTGVNNATYTVTVVDATRFTIGVNTAPFGAYTSGGQASRIALSSSVGAWVAGATTVTSTISALRSFTPDGPYADLRIGVAPQDADGVTAQTAAFNLDADDSGVLERVQVGATQARFGRMVVRNSHGSELLGLRLPLYIEHWNGTVFQTNTDDDCTTIGSSANVLFGNYRGGISAANMTNASNLTLGGAVLDGASRLILSKPTPAPASSGSVDLTVDLAAESKTYLQGKWSGASYNQNPVGRATFGVRRAGPVIYLREMY